MKKKLLIILLVIVVVIGVSVLGLMSYLESNLEQLTDMKMSDIDLSSIPDGVCTGSYKMFPVDAKVKVTIADNKITDIELVEHGNGQGKPAEVIPERVVEAQSLKVDAVTGATYSSQVILKAIENALLNADI